MHLLIIHPETVVGGAEKMLHYFLPTLSARALRVTVAIADGPLRDYLPESVPTVIVPDHTKFSVLNLLHG